MAEVHVIGEIYSAQDFPDNQLCCRWQLKTGGGWRVIAGDREGQTQTDLPTTETAYFAHPLNIHLSTRTIQGWPRINLEVWHHDQYGRLEVYGYGTAFIPSSPGEHIVECQCWRPKGTTRDEIMQFFVGGGLQLRSINALESPADRFKLQTVAMGVVKLRISIITRYFDRFGIGC